MPVLMDVTGERPGCLPKSKEESFLPVIGSNRSSQSSSQGDSPYNNPQSDLAKNVSDSVAENLRLPCIDRSKTNSICSLASNNTCNSRTRRTNSFRASNPPELCRSPSCPNLADFDNRIMNDNVTQELPPPFESFDHNDDTKTLSEHQLPDSIKLPIIGKSNGYNSTKRRKNKNNNAEKLGHDGRSDDVNKSGQNASVYSDDLRWSVETERNSVLVKYLSSSRQFNEEHNVRDEMACEYARLWPSESTGSVHSQTTNQMPVLFPLRLSETRGSRRSRKASRVGRAATKDALKENQLREVAERLEHFRDMDEDADAPLSNGRNTGKQSRNSSTPRTRHSTGNPVHRRSNTTQVLQSRAIKDSYENTRKKQPNS